MHEGKCIACCFDLCVAMECSENREVKAICELRVTRYRQSLEAFKNYEVDRILKARELWEAHQSALKHE